MGMVLMWLKNRLCCSCPCLLAWTPSLKWYGLQSRPGGLFPSFQCISTSCSASVPGAMVNMLVPLRPLSLPPMKVPGSQRPYNACCPWASYRGSFPQRQTMRLHDGSGLHAQVQGAFPGVFPCTSLPKVARPRERLTRPLIPWEEPGFSGHPGTMAFWLLFLIQILGSYCFPLDKKKMKLNISL